MTLTDEELDNLTDEERKELAAKALAPILERIRKSPLPRDKRVSGRTSPDWRKQAFGIFAGSETFEESVRHGEAWRNTERPKDAEG